MFCSVSVPFFFEPNFDAVISPLSSLSRLTNPVDRKKIEKKKRDNVKYGDFLLKKVSGNFSEDSLGNMGMGMAAMKV